MLYRTLLLTLLFLFLSTEASAKWTRVGSGLINVTRVDGVSLNVEYETVSYDEGKVKIWTMWNLEKQLMTAWGFPYGSTKSLLEFDCKSRTLRTLVEYLYFEQMAKGKPYSSNDYPDAEWRFVSGDDTETYYKAACGK